MVNGKDYNGKQGRHPNNCDCDTHSNTNPMAVTEGANQMTTETPNFDADIIAALKDNPIALNNYMQLIINNAAPSSESTQTQVPTNVPSIPMLDEYIIPLTDPTHKPSGFSTLSDGRNLPQTFNKLTDAVRITKIYANKGILGTDKWELVLRKVK